MSSFKEHWQGQARACAKGHKQLAFVDELLVGDSYYKMEGVPGKPWMGRVAVFGAARLDGRSYRNLEKRLNRAGFQIATEDTEDVYFARLRLI